MPNPIVVNLALEHAAALRRMNNSAILTMSAQWRHVRDSLSDRIDNVAKEISLLQAQGKEVTIEWLRELDYYKALAQQADNEIGRYLQYSQSFTEQQMMDGIMLGIDQGTEKALSINLRNARTMTYFKGLPVPQIESIRAISMRDAPLGKLFDSIKPNSGQLIADALMNGLAAGMPMRNIATLMTKAVNFSYNRALLIARTEVNRAHRSATLQTYQQYEVPYYRRLASRKNACFACMMLDGTVYTSQNALDDHPNGACQMVPISDPNDPTTDWVHGKERFENMTETEQRNIMGNKHYESWKSGNFTLDQAVVVRQNAIWGGSPGIRPLKDLARG